MAFQKTMRAEKFEAVKPTDEEQQKIAALKAASKKS